MEIINKAELSERLADDMDLLRDLGALFLEDYTALLNKIEKTIAEEDGPALKKAAHTLKGSVANFSAQQAYDAAYNLEMIGKEGDLNGVEDAFLQVKASLDEFTDALKELMKQDSILA